MASNSKICKLKISLSDIDQNHYDTLNLTVAQHPSETTGRMMVRILVFCINTRKNLEFTKGLNAVDEPDIWARSLDDQLLLWQAQTLIGRRGYFELVSGKKVISSR